MSEALVSFAIYLPPHIHGISFSTTFSIEMLRKNSSPLFCSSLHKSRIQHIFLGEKESNVNRHNFSHLNIYTVFSLMFALHFSNDAAIPTKFDFVSLFILFSFQFGRSHFVYIFAWCKCGKGCWHSRFSRFCFCCRQTKGMNSKSNT